MSSSHPSDKQHSTYLPQFGIYVLMAVLGAVLTFTAIRVFPAQLIPAELRQRSDIETSVNPGSVSLSEVQKTDPHNFVVAAVRRVGGAVVRIDTERTITIPRPRFFDDPFFERFFGRDTMPKIPWEYRQLGEGSGFIIDSNGMILTNAHLVSGVNTVQVSLKDGRTFKGKVQGIDRPSDLAVVKIDGQNLPVATLGNSKDLQVGDWAIAVGNPFGLDNTVTLGIISTLKRSSGEVGIPDKRLNFIQTDAAINPGNSGGPLLNARGEVIGINTAIRPGASGIGFAIPIDTAKAIKDALARGEKISHPYIGIRMVTLTKEIANQLNSDPNTPFSIAKFNGVLAIEVLPNSPAENAGLQPKDVIVEVNGQSVTSAEQLQEIVANSRIGQPLQLKVWRKEKLQQFSVRPTNLEE
jgi:S1-C subfamily serine protease